MDPATAQLAITAGIFVAREIIDLFHQSPHWQSSMLTQQPTSNEGQPVPLIFGQVKVTRPGLIWYGNFGFVPADPSSGNAMEQRDRYGINMLYVIGVPMHPVAGTACRTQLIALYSGDSGAPRQPTFPLNHGDEKDLQVNAFGFDITQGGGFGTMLFYGGATDQQMSARMLAALNQTAQNTPGFRRQIAIGMIGNGYFGGLKGWYMGDQQQVPPVSFEVRTTYPLFNSLELASGDADPCAVLVEILTADWAKMNLQPSQLDMASFAVASATLYAELHGYSRVFDQETDAKSALQEVMNQVGGSLYQDPYTGLITIKLWRGGYDVTDLNAVPLFTADDIESFSEYQVSGWADLPNIARVRYNSRDAGYQDAIAVAQNMASAVLYDAASVTGQPAGKIRAVDIDYPGCCTAFLAQQLAQRDLNVRSQPLARGQVNFKRRAHTLRPGSLFQLTFPEYGLNRVVMRVVKVDLNQLGDNRVVVDFVQDAFQGSATGFGTTTFPPPTFMSPEPLTVRKFTEAPYWMMLQAKQAGKIVSADDQRILALAHPDDSSTRFRELTPPQFIILGQPYTYSIDVKETPYPNFAKLYAPYGKLPEPYDSTNGILIWQLSDAATKYLQTFPQWTYNDLHTYGRALIYVGDEIIQYESATNLGNGVWRLNTIWRSQLDTTARDHVAGESCYWLAPTFTGNQAGSSSYVGTKSWQGSLGGQLNGQAVPKGDGIGSVGIGSGEEATDSLTVALRGLLPARVADIGICGEVIAGSQGSPATNATLPQLGFYKAATSLEEGFGHVWKMRDHKATTVSRGDEAAETPSDAQATTIELYAQKVRTGFAPSVPVNDAEVAIPSGNGLTATNQAAGLLLGKAGYGDVDVRFHSQRILPAGTIGNVSPLTLREWDTPKVRVRAERWRSLLANVRFDFAGAGTNIAPWTVGSGTPKVYADGNSISTLSTDCYVAADANCSLSQTVDVSGYKPRGMFAVLRWYDKVITASTTTTIAVDLIALDGNNTQLGIASQTAVTPATTSWTSRVLTLSLPSGTVSVKVNVTLQSTTAKGPAAAEFRLQVGTPQDNVLSNFSFDTDMSSWTFDAGSFLSGTSGRSPSTGLAQGGPFTQSVMHQDYTLPTSYTWGSTAVLECWRMQQSGATFDSGSVTLSVLDGSGNVLASTSTGVEDYHPNLNIWIKRRLSLDLPTTGAAPAKLRVTCLANRLTFSSGNSGALFDEIVLQVWKDLSDARYYRALTFDTPTVQPVPGTWQEWHLAFPDLFAVGIADPSVFAGAQISCQRSPNFASLQMVWADQQFHSGQLLAPCVGQWGGGTPYIKGYRFARQSGLTALDWQSYNEGSNRFASPTSAGSFSVGVLYRIDELPFSAGCGLTGRRDSNSGWGLDITAAGFVRATLQGTGGTITATASTNVADGAWHMAWIVYDANAQTLTVLDEASSATVSTVTLGEIANTSAACVFRIGRDVNTRDTIPGMIAREWVFAQALMPSQVARHWNYAKDPTGRLASYARSAAAWFPGLPVTDGALGSAAGANDHTLAKLAAIQVGHGYIDALTADGGTGWGLALTAGAANNIPSIDFTNPAFWLPDAGTALTQGIIDATGRPRGVTVAGDLNNGLRMLGLSNGSGVNCCVSFYARCLAGARVLAVTLLDANDSAKQTILVTLSAQWQRYDCQFTAWDNATTTCHVLFKCDKPTAQVFSFDLTHIMWSGSTFEPAAAWADPGASLSSDIVATVTETQLAQLNLEGEVIATGVCPHASPKGPFTIATVDNGSDNKNRRELVEQTVQRPEFEHYDSAGPTNVASTGTAIAWNQIWDLRGRWSPTMLDNASFPFAGLVVDVGSVTSATYGRNASWTFDGTLNSRIRLGAGANASINAYLRQLIIRAREEKLA